LTHQISEGLGAAKPFSTTKLVQESAVFSIPIGMGCKIMLAAEGNCPFTIDFYQSYLGIQIVAFKMDVELTESLNFELPLAAL
jgi:hypothetical protein